ncbi:MAG: hypothetical protein KGL43_26390, partial [Burkholderiales bacterium]|nr:hypothetical protein [Burkholderiales bacterium]
MKLIPFSARYLRKSESLPFGLRDAAGRLLLAGGQVIGDDLMHALEEQPLFADESESAVWHRRLQTTMDTMLRQGASLGAVAAARPEDSAARVPVSAPLPLGEQWATLAMHLDAVLRLVKPGSAWLGRFEPVHGQARQLAEKRPDASLYHLIYSAGHSTEKYSTHHALLTMLICEEVASLLQWTPGQRDSIGRAALLMNLAMTRLQDLLAQSDREPTPEMRRQIAAHAEEGARQLGAAGLDDALCIEAVRLHHDASQECLPFEELTPARRLARLLRRVDIFGAKLSRRQRRVALSPMQAARQACLGADGQPDEIGAALLKTVGLYPPGSFVELVSGEVAIVIARGRRANLPLVASLVSPSGTPLGEPLLRDTLSPRHAVRAAVPPSAVRV